ncbi:phospholipase effector Tle1 domain-containing protein [Providencia alcalifaciens]|uniref:phospholipase effector Tle1 domain-containing protein n=1 Tax=Providencia alcalifaciens TaxID=126385 RepID=UPI00300F9146
MDQSLRSLEDDVKSKPVDLAKDAFQSAMGGTSGKDILKQTKDKLLSPKDRAKMLKDTYINSGRKAGIEATPWLRDSEFMAYTFVTGADSRLNSAKVRFVRSFEEATQSGEIPVKLISVSVFGFDMGGTLARQFLDILLEDLCEKDEKKKGGRPVYRGTPVNIVFAGLFDCSRDTPLSSDNGLDYAAEAVSWLPGPVAKVAGTVGSLFGRKYLEHMSPLPNAVRRSLHLVAAHERRRWRCIYRTGREGVAHEEILMPGCSEDIGGGFKPDEQKPSAELSRVSLRKMYTEAMMSAVPFLDLEKLYKKDLLVWSYFDIKDNVESQSVEEWAEDYQMTVGMQKLGYGAMNWHLDGYFEWLGRQFYEYKSELRRLEKEKSDTLTGPGSLQGGFGITRQAKQDSSDIDNDIRLLKKHWSWLSEVSRAADVLLTQKFNNPPELYVNNILEPARRRARYFIQCGEAGYDSKAPPIRICVDSRVLYAWFVHDVQRAEGINDGYFSIRWMEPRK